MTNLPRATDDKGPTLIDPISILHIEDNQADATLVSEQLCNKNYAKYIIENTGSLLEAQALLSKQTYDIVFLDLSLTDSEGICTLESLREIDNNIPVIVLTGNHDDSIIDEILYLGGQDYICKDEFNVNHIDRTIRYAIERKKTEQELETLAHYDSLTGLYNRAIFMDRLKHSLENNKRQAADSHIVTILLDLDSFKKINDTLGHSAGDSLLIQAARRLKDCVRETDTVARLGGDEFTILFENIESLNNFSVVANKILSSLAEPFLIENQKIFTSASIGISCSKDEKNITAEKILKNADMAMYTAKNKGGNQVGFFTRELQVTAQIRSNLENSLKTAIEEDQLQLFFQPQINIHTGKISGAETLLRWNHPQHGLIPPNGFLPALEETGLIIPATEWVIKKALNYWQTWQSSENRMRDLSVSINISPNFINQYKFYESIKHIYQQYSINKNQIEFELVENAFINITQKNLHELEKLNTEGFRLAIDDFGTGYSSLGYLKAFPIDCIKLDKTFVKDIIESPKDEAIAEAMINLCQKLGINLVAEGVDSSEKLARLKGLGCQIIQGFHFSKPLAPEDFIRYVKNYKTS